jgi:hypothetical protein
MHYLYILEAVFSVEFELRRAVVGEEFDYGLLMGVLAGYKSPRAKVTSLLRKKIIVRVKKGLYVFGPELARRPFSHMVLANMCFGPSCLSLEYALSLHGLIPERVPVVTSVTPQRNKDFETPVGVFTYRYLHSNRYPVGICRQTLGDGTPFLLAGPEKALADWLVLRPGHPAFEHEDELHRYLELDLRLEQDGLSGS